MTHEAVDLVALLRGQTDVRPDEVAYTFLVDGETDEIHLTYGELDRRARAIATMLRRHTAADARVMLLYPPGLDYIAGFLGCLYAGVVAVPAYPPDPMSLERSLPRIRSIARDAEVSMALTTTPFGALLEGLSESAPELAALPRLTTDVLERDAENDWRPPAIHGETLAFLQYTSGSTGLPKGVMLTHANLFFNIGWVARHCPRASGSPGTTVSWLPPYHDMGLIFGILASLRTSTRAILLSPLDFLQRPMRWLQAISRYRGLVSGGPGFAYELCVRRISASERATLDLSTWSLAPVGAEPVRADILERFVSVFAETGFRSEAFAPGYGLAEATLMVSGGRRKAPPLVKHVERAALEKGRVVEAVPGTNRTWRLVGCGAPLPDQRFLLVDPVSCSPSDPERVGEIWIAGPSVARGYWNRPDETAATFGARLADTNEGPFLRTGDLGFILDGELFVTDRMKDLIIIHGRNLSPLDIELTVERCHAGLRPGCGAAFSVVAEGEERLIVIQEAKPALIPQQGDVIQAIRTAIAEHHGVAAHAVLLIEPRSLPKTSSGKVQRHACRSGYLADTLAVIAAWSAPRTSHDGPAMPNVSTGKTVRAIQEWLVSRLGDVTTEEIDIHEPFSHHGFDSIRLVGLCGDLEAFLGRRLSPTLLYRYPTIAAMARHLGAESTALRAKCDQTDRVPQREPIAVVGIGCRLPGASGPEAFWRLLSDGRDAITEIPPERTAMRAFHGQERPAWGGFLTQIDGFDPEFFRMSHREARRLDPQHRILLEVMWEALEDAGIVADELAGSRSGVFIGISSNDYGALVSNDSAQMDVYSVTGNASALAANRISYLLDLRGPSMAIDTACSSSLVAVHLACQSLWNGETRLAFAGGVNLILSPSIGVAFTKAWLTARDGRCKTFDARADGYVRSEGAGIVVLKPLSAAVANGDPIYAVIRASAVNHNGRANGIIAPSEQAQEMLVRDAHTRAGVDSSAVQYVEAHGTGTLLGDPIEAKALGAAFASQRHRDNPCLIGSAKTNVGHLEAAAGIVGLIKVALSLRHRTIPPHLHFQEPNPHIPFDELGLRVPVAREPWPKSDTSALAGVSSFGFGGTNAHVVLSDAALPPTQNEATPSVATSNILTLSARSSGALRDLALSYAAHLVGGGAEASSLRDVCFTANVRRTHHQHRLAVVATSRQQLVDHLHAFASGSSRSAVFRGSAPRGGAPRIVLVFPGTLSNRRDGIRELAKREPTYQAVLAACDEWIIEQTGTSFARHLEPAASYPDSDQHETAAVVLFASQVALVDLWRSWGIEPSVVVGDGAGEAAASYVAGMLSLRDAVRLVCAQSMAGVEVHPAIVPWISTASGGPTEKPYPSPSSWPPRIHEQDLLAATAERLAKEGHEVFIEVGLEPVVGEALARGVSSCRSKATILPGLEAARGASERMLAIVGALYTLGYPLRWDKLHRSEGRHTSLPTYPWQRRRFWFDDPPDEGNDSAARGSGIPSAPRPDHAQEWKQTS